jgi:hypothetical protein
MEYSLKDKKGGKAKAFKEIVLSDGTKIGVFQGSRGQNPDLDILIRYEQKGKKVRTPKHIHWVIDLLIKKEHNRKLTLEFIKYLRELYDKVEPFSCKADQQKCELKETTKAKLKKFEPLNKWGEYRVEFIGNLIELMIRMEKTGNAKAFMFKKGLEAMIKEKDIFQLVSTATHNGR